MNNKGFTLVEVLVVIVLLGLIIGIAVPNVLKTGNKAKERTLLTKVNNIEKAAVLYGQDHRNNFDSDNSSYDINRYPYCYSGNTKIENCYYYNTPIIVDNLATPETDASGTIINEAYIEYDDKVNSIIKNPTDETKDLNACPIQIYKKYGKIYAVYTDKTKPSTSGCWVQ